MLRFLFYPYTLSLRYTCSHLIQTIFILLLKTISGLDPLNKKQARCKSWLATLNPVYELI